MHELIDVGGGEAPVPSSVGCLTRSCFPFKYASEVAAGVALQTDS